MWAKGHMSDTLPQFLFLQIKGHYEVPLKKKKRNTTKSSGLW